LARFSGTSATALSSETPPFPRNPLEQQLDAVPVDAVAVHEEADQRIANQFGERTVSLAVVIVVFPVHRFYPYQKPASSLMSDSWAVSAARAISELAMACRRTAQAALFSMLPSRSHPTRNRNAAGRRR
jgi:hypothetical protein